ncbi:MAG: hypothetical protein WAK55_17440 [Xanthobacteraceae bacterium]
MEYAFRSDEGRIESFWFNTPKAAQMYAQQTELEYLGAALAVLA